jgi:molecular chaperone DnaJ
MAVDLYAVLGVERGAGAEEIRRAYRRLARRYHPGINPGDREAEARFAQITEAFETLSDPERREAYDAGRGAAERRREEPGGFAFGFEGFDFSVAVRAEHEVSTFGELFADVLGRPAASGPEPGTDLHVNLTVSFDESIVGAQRSVAVTRQIRCRTCAGAGVLGTAPAPCAACQGTGRIRAARGHMVFAKPCAECRGSGQCTEIRCRSCAGQGVETRVDRATIDLPPGIADGAQLRLPGAGHAGRRGGRPGDLLVEVHVTPHPLFRRDGDDLHLLLPVAVHEAALGARIEVPTPDGAVRVRVPPGTQSGQRLRLRERGATSPRTGVRGDLIVEVRLVLPALLDERSKELLREFGRINAEDVRQGLWDSQGT